MKTSKNKSEKNDPQKFNEGSSKPSLGERIVKISDAILFWSFVFIIIGFILKGVGLTVVGGIILTIFFSLLFISFFVSLFLSF